MIIKSTIIVVALSILAACSSEHSDIERRYMTGGHFQARPAISEDGERLAFVNFKSRDRVALCARTVSNGHTATVDEKGSSWYRWPKFAGDDLLIFQRSVRQRIDWVVADNEGRVNVLFREGEQQFSDVQLFRSRKADSLYFSAGLEQFDDDLPSIPGDSYRKGDWHVLGVLNVATRSPSVLAQGHGPFTSIVSRSEDEHLFVRTQAERDSIVSNILEYSNGQIRNEKSLPGVWKLHSALGDHFLMSRRDELGRYRLHILSKDTEPNDSIEDKSLSIMSVVVSNEWPLTLGIIDQVRTNPDGTFVYRAGIAKLETLDKVEKLEVSWIDGAEGMLSSPYITANGQYVSYVATTRTGRGRGKVYSIHVKDETVRSHGSNYED